MMTTLLLEREETDPKSLKKDLSLIDKSARQCETLLTDVLDLSKIEAGKMDVEYNDFDLPNTVDDVVEGFFVKQKKGVLLTSFVDPKLSTWHVGDQNRITQILTNLVGNALKFTHQGSVILKASPTEVPNEVLFEVEDTGIGISEDKIEKLFNPFVQTHKNTSEKNYGGTGLGQ